MLDPIEIKKYTENLDECNPPENFLKILKIKKKQMFSRNIPDSKPIKSVDNILIAD